MDALVCTTTNEVDKVFAVGRGSKGHIVTLTEKVERDTIIVFLDIDIYWAAIKRGAP